MVHALTMSGLHKKCKESYGGESRIVGIMLARYDKKSVQEMINENYLYWHDNTGKNFDIFWAGYGAYLCPNEENKSKKILDFNGNENCIYFDRDAFISIKSEICSVLNRNYRDNITLVLVNYHSARLHFDEMLMINLEEIFLSDRYVSEFIELLTLRCKSEHDITSLKVKLKLAKDYITPIKAVRFIKSLRDIF